MFLFYMYYKIYFFEPDLITSLKLYNLFIEGLYLTVIYAKFLAFAITTLFLLAFAG